MLENVSLSRCRLTPSRAAHCVTVACDEGSDTATASALTILGSPHANTAAVTKGVPSSDRPTSRIRSGSQVYSRELRWTRHHGSAESTRRRWVARLASPTHPSWFAFPRTVESRRPVQQHHAGPTALPATTAHGGGRPRTPHKPRRHLRSIQDDHSPAKRCRGSRSLGPHGPAVDPQTPRQIGACRIC
jgi:hypothetical protein